MVYVLLESVASWATLIPSKVAILTVNAVRALSSISLISPARNSPDEVAFVFTKHQGL